MTTESRFDLSSVPGSSASIASGSPEVVRVITGLSPTALGTTVWGPAFTVKGRAGDNLALHRGLAAASPGDVIVAQLDGDEARGHWGELMTIAAQVAGVAGLVIDAPIRDLAAIAARGFPAFHLGVHPSPAAKAVPGELQVPIVVLGVAVHPGDGVYGDADGIVVIPGARVAAVVEAAIRVELRERDIAARIAAGEGTMRVLGLDGNNSAAIDG